MLCAGATPIASVNNSYVLDKNSKNGLLLASIKYEILFLGYQVYFQGIDNKLEAYFEAGSRMGVIPISRKSDFPDGKGQLQVVELPAGEYEINRWRVDSRSAKLSTTQPFSIKFEIEPGEVRYIGSFTFSATKGSSLDATAVTVNYKDDYFADVTALRNNYPNLERSEIFMGLPSGLVKSELGGESSLYWMPIVVMPVVN